MHIFQLPNLFEKVMQIPKKSPKRNPAHVERVNRKKARRVTQSLLQNGANRYLSGETGEYLAPTLTPKKAARKAGFRGERPRCGLCGKTGKLTKTDCCGQWICDDEDQYVLFSYDTNSCHRNHDRYTLCAHHHEEGHAGAWQDCPECREDFETEMYVWYGTNEYNFEKLANPPAYEPTTCAKCGKVIHLGEGGYSICGNDYFCIRCGGFAQVLRGK